MAQVLAQLAPDILVLSGIDYDLDTITLRGFRDLVAGEGHAMPYSFAPKPNAGFATGVDLNSDGDAYGLDDAHGFAWFTGADALGVLSQHPLATERMRDFSQMLWRDLPDARLYSEATPEQLAMHRLASVAHFALPATLPDGSELMLLVYQAGPPVFGGHPDRNLNRNHDETAFWLRYLNADLPYAPQDAPFVLIGGTNLDPFDGDGLHAAMRDLLAHPKLQDPRPASMGALAHADKDHVGPARLDTVDWGDPQGKLRVSYILPSSDLRVIQSGVVWPLADDPLAKLLAQTGIAHKPVWVDLMVN